MAYTYDPEAEVPTPAVPRTLVRAAAPLPAFGAERSFGFGGGYGPGGSGPTASEKASLERAATIKANDLALGAPTSYGGGVRTAQPEIPAPNLSTAGGGYNPGRASFSNPVHVIRRLASTWAGPGPGEEHKTLAEANQAFNRERGIGEYVPPGGELQKLKNEGETKKAEILATREPPGQKEARDLQVEALKREQATKIGQTNVASLQRWLPTLPGMGIMKDGKLTFVPKDENVARDILAAEEIARTKGVEEAKTHFLDSLKVRQYEPLFSAEAIAEGRKNPAWWRRIVLEQGPKKAAMAGPQAQPRKWWQGTPIQEQRPIDWGKVIPPATETVPPM